MFITTQDIGSFLNQRLGDQRRVEREEAWVRNREFAAADNSITEMKKELGEEIRDMKYGGPKAAALGQFAAQSPTRARAVASVTASSGGSLPMGDAFRG